MATTGWFVPNDEAPQCPGLGAEVAEGPESEAGGSSAPLPTWGVLTIYVLLCYRLFCCLHLLLCSNRLTSFLFFLQILWLEIGRARECRG